MAIGEGRTVFLDGLLVTREHLNHLQDTLLADVVQVRQTAGLGKVCFGLKVEAGDAGKVKINPGTAFDAQGRPVIVPAVQQLAVAFGDVQTLFLAAAFVLKSDLVISGTPTILKNDFLVELRKTPPPYADFGVRVAELHAQPGGFTIVQSGDWFLPPLDHRHSDKFLDDPVGGFRFDGQPLGLQPPQFDSGFLSVPLGGELTLVHGLNTINLMVEMQGRVDGVITTKGRGGSFWYDLPGPQQIRLARSNDPGPLDMRVILWSSIRLALVQWRRWQTQVPTKSWSSALRSPWTEAGPELSAGASSFNLSGHNYLKGEITWQNLQ